MLCHFTLARSKETYDLYVDTSRFPVFTVLWLSYLLSFRDGHTSYGLVSLMYFRYECKMICQTSNDPVMNAMN